MFVRTNVLKDEAAMDICDMSQRLRYHKTVLYKNMYFIYCQRYRRERYYIASLSMYHYTESTRFLITHSVAWVVYMAFAWVEWVVYTVCILYELTEIFFIRKVVIGGILHWITSHVFLSWSFAIKEYLSWALTKLRSSGVTEDLVSTQWKLKENSKRVSSQ